MHPHDCALTFPAVPSGVATGYASIVFFEGYEVGQFKTGSQRGAVKGAGYREPDALVGVRRFAAFTDRHSTRFDHLFELLEV
jgi:hypothetical protein